MSFVLRARQGMILRDDHARQASECLDAAKRAARTGNLIEARDQLAMALGWRQSAGATMRRTIQACVRDAQ